MIRYELKDKERQAALEKVLPGFTDELQRACKIRESLVARGTGVSSLVTLVHHTEADCWVSGEWIFVLPIVDIETIGKYGSYDPSKWNKYPEVTPPEGVWMRVETWSAVGATVRGVFMYTKGAWRRSKYTSPNNEIKVARFRPWDEEEKNE